MYRGRFSFPWLQLDVSRLTPDEEAAPAAGRAISVGCSLVHGEIVELCLDRFFGVFEGCGKQSDRASR